MAYILRKGPYIPETGDKITVNTFMHITVHDILSGKDANPIFADDETRRFNADGFRQYRNGECRPYADEMSAKEVERLLTVKGGRVYRKDEGESFRIVLSTYHSDVNTFL